jgi:hypothetical protein
MTKKTVFSVIGILALVSSIAMYMIGKDSSHLSELKDFWWIPLPLALICFIAAGKKTKA